MIALRILIIILVLAKDIAAFIWFRRKMKPWVRFISLIVLIVISALSVLIFAYAVKTFVAEAAPLAENYFFCNAILIGVALWYNITRALSKVLKEVGIGITKKEGVGEFMGLIPMIHFWMTFAGGVFGHLTILFEWNV